MLIVSMVLFQILMVVGLIVIFRKILNQNVSSATRHLESMNEEYVKKEKELNCRLEEIDDASNEKIQKATEEGEEERKKILDEAEGQKQHIINDARNQAKMIVEQAEKTRDLLILEIDDRITQEGLGKACELIQHCLPEEFKREIHTRWVKELLENGFENSDHMQVDTSVEEAKIRTAFTLSETDMENIQKRISEYLKHDVRIAQETDSKLVAGIVVTIGSLVFDGSLNNRVQEQVSAQSK